MLSRTEWAAIHCTDGKEWINIMSIRGLRELTSNYTASLLHSVPAWSRDNPVVRVSQISITEVMKDGTQS